MARRARSDDRAGHGWVGGREGHREVGHRQARLRGKRGELLDGVEPAFVTEGLKEGGAHDVGLPTFADAAGEHALPERSPHEDAHPVALRGREDLSLYVAVEDGVGRLLGVEPRPRPRCSATHCVLTMSDAGVVVDPMARTLPLRMRSESAESVCSMSVSGFGRTSLEGSCLGVGGSPA